MAKYTFPKIVSLFRKFGGFRLIGAYAKLRVLGFALRRITVGLFERKAPDEIFYSYEPKIIDALNSRYRPIMLEKLSSYERDALPRHQSDIVWFCWLQGLECAPPIVKACYHSLVDNLGDKTIRVIDDNNRNQYVHLPDFIERRREKGQIPHALFADLLRLELLIRYGGTWIDSTVYCSNPNYPREYLNADLFFFQYAHPDNRAYSGISNWFITASTNNLLLMTLRDMLYAYWKEFDCVVEYFIFHRFFDILAAARPNIVSQMPYGYSPNCHILLRHWHELFDETRWNRFISRVSFHKLAHQIADSVKEDSSNYYNHIVHQGLL